jgi:hypothetical protein
MSSVGFPSPLDVSPLKPKLSKLGIILCF